MKTVVLPLLGAGLEPQAVFVQLRSMYGADVNDREIRNLIEWAITKNPQPCAYNWNRRDYDLRSFRRAILPERGKAEQAIVNTEKWLGGFRCDGCDLWDVSPWRPLEDWRVDALMVFGCPLRQG